MRSRLPGAGSRDALLESQVFRQLGPDLHDQLFSRMTERQYEPGETLIRQGDPGDCLMLLLEGEALVLVHDATTSQQIARFGKGDVVGEMALLTGESRTADVVADTDVRTLVLEVGAFQELAMQHPELGMVLTQLVADRLGEGSLDGLTGKTVGNYEIGRCLGRGAMAVVYEAREIDTDRRVALKMMSHRLLYEPGANARFQREADILLELRHPNIARVFHQFTSFRTSFMALELCDGPNLGQVVDRHGALGEARARPLIGQIAAALAHLHDVGVVHRDLKPVNVMSTLDGTLKITDFGLAKNTEPAQMEEALTDSRTILGTPLYMAPEQISGQPATPAADVYALGCIAWRLLTGERLFSSPTFFELMQEKHALKLPPADQVGEGVSDEMHEVLVRSLAKEPAARDLDLSAVATWAAPADLSLLQ